MKKLLLICASAVVAVATYGQGSVGLYNDGNTLFTTNNGIASGAIRGGNQYRIGLYTAAPGTVNESLFTLVGFATNSSLSAGRFQYGSSGAFDIPGNTGQPIAFQIRAWSLALGPSYEAAVASNQPGWGGKSPISASFTPTASSTAPVPALFGDGSIPGQLTTGVQLAQIGVVPEPSTIALGLLGLGAIALFRRRK